MSAFFKNIISALKKQWFLMLLASAVWTGLGYLWAIGVRNVGLLIINYLTGAVLSLEGGNIVGGTIGRGILFITLNSFLTSFILHKGSFPIRVHYAKKAFKSNIKKLNNYVDSFSVFATKDARVIALAMLGMGVSLIVNSFITGNASFINSFVNLALFAIIIDQIQEKRGFIIACVNAMLQKGGYREINGELIIAFMSSLALGCLVAPITYLIPVWGLAYMVGAVLTVLGLLLFLLTNKRKEEKTC